jgi:hypothetical protein
MNTTPAVVYQSESCRIATLGSSVLVLWRSHMDAEGARQQELALLRLAKGRSAVGLLPYVPVGVKAPTAEVRALLNGTLNKLSPTLVGVAVTTEDAGFHAAIVRSVALSISNLSRAKAPSRSFGTVAEAAAWLRERMGPQAQDEPTVEEFVRALDQLRRLP